MELTHPSATWTLEYTDHRATGPRRLESQGATLFSFVHARIDGISDDDLAPKKIHHYHKGGAALFEGLGEFAQGAPAKLRQIHRIAGNAVRVTYDLTWPKDTPLKKGLELGSVILAGNWLRYFLVCPDLPAITWKELPADGAAPVILSPLPSAIVLEDNRGRQLEWGLGDDLWRWEKGLNGEFLHAKGRLELSRNGNRLTLRRYVAFCNPDAEAKAAESLAQDPRFQPKADKEGNLIATPVPVSQPDARDYRFNAYFSWSEPDLIPDFSLAEKAIPLVMKPQNGLERSDIDAAGENPCVKLDLSRLPIEDCARRNGQKDAPPCWESRNVQAYYRKLIRQLADATKKGVLVLENMTPGWCDVATHETRRGKASHWDLPAILDTMAWTRQILGNQWTILVPQSGIWQELPSLSALGAPSGFRIDENSTLA